MIDTFTQLYQNFTSEGVQNRAPKILNNVEEPGRVDSTPETNTEVIITPKQQREKIYRKDSEALLRVYPVCYGDELSVSLQELLTICPRKRQRADAYVGLVGYMKRIYNVNLVIL